MTNQRLQALKSRIEEMLEVEAKATPITRYELCVMRPPIIGLWQSDEQLDKNARTAARVIFRPMLEGWLGVIAAVESCRETDLAGDEEESQESCYHCDPYLKLLAALADQLEVK